MLTQEARRLPGVQTFIVPSLGRRIHAISDLLPPGQTATDLADPLLQTAHVATVPGDAFNAPNHLRICFAIDDNTLDEAI